LERVKFQQAEIKFYPGNIMFVNFLLLATILLRLIIGIRLVILARQNNLPNVYWLAAQFFLFIIGVLFAPTAGNPLGNLPVSLSIFTVVGVLLAQIVILAFNHTTFYQGRKSPLWWFVGAFAIFATIGLYGLINSESNYNQSPLLAFPHIMTILAWGWHGWNAFQALKGISKEEAVENWVKARYQLVIAYSVVLIIAAGGSFIRNYFAAGTATNPLGNAMAILALVAQIVAVSLQFLAWVMPESFRLWLNRKQQTHGDQQRNSMLSIFSAAMTADTGLKSMACLYAIRATVARRIRSEDSATVQKYLNEMTYIEWEATLQHSELRRILINGGADQASATKAIENACLALVEKQSLLTLSAR
jgi:hypothetical protein